MPFSTKLISIILHYIGGAKRAYTAEQESASKKIIALSKKSHYDCLEIPKTATEADIKAAYRSDRRTDGHMQIEMGGWIVNR